MLSFILVAISLGLIIGLTIAILYLLNLQNTLKAAAPANRKMKPGMVWLLLIPVFSSFWRFVVAVKISDTISAEFSSKAQTPPVARPTYGLGMTLAILELVSIIITIYLAPQIIEQVQMMMLKNMTPPVNTNPLLSMFRSLLSLAAFIVWIAYWVQTAAYKNKMKMLPAINDNRSVFKGVE